MFNITSSDFKNFRQIPDSEISKNNDILHGVFQRGNATLIFAKPKVGKSLVLQLLISAITMGKKTINESPVVHGDVIYFCGEGDHGAIKRLRAYQNHYKDREAGNLYICSKAFLLNEESLPTVKELISKAVKNPVLIIFDIMALYCGDVNAPGEMASYMNCCNELASYFNCAVCNVHHASKSKDNEPMGSIYLTAMHANYFSVEQKNDKTIFRQLGSKDDTLENPIELTFKEEYFDCAGQTLKVGILTDD